MFLILSTKHFDGLEYFISKSLSFMGSMLYPIICTYRKLKGQGV